MCVPCHGDNGMFALFSDFTWRCADHMLSRELILCKHVAQQLGYFPSSKIRGCFCGERFEGCPRYAEKRTSPSSTAETLHRNDGCRRRMASISPRADKVAPRWESRSKRPPVDKTKWTCDYDDDVVSRATCLLIKTRVPL